MNPRIQGTSSIYSTVNTTSSDNQQLHQFSSSHASPSLVAGPHHASQHFLGIGIRQRVMKKVKDAGAYVRDKANRLRRGGGGGDHQLLLQQEKNRGGGKGGGGGYYADWYTWLMGFVQYICWALHLSVCAYAFYTWRGIATHASGKGFLLKQKAYFMTDHISASLHMGGRGYVTPPLGESFFLVSDLLLL